MDNIKEECSKMGLSMIEANNLHTTETDRDLM